MLHVMPRTWEGQRTKVTTEVPGARRTHTSNNNATSCQKTSMLYATQRYITPYQTPYTIGWQGGKCTLQTAP